MRMSDILQGVGRPVVYYPKLISVLGGLKEAAFICQLVYWIGKQRDKEGWIYKTQKQIREETGLTRYEQETVRKNLKKLGILEEKYQGIPRKLYFRVNLAKLREVWEKHLGKLREQESNGDSYNKFY